MAMVLLAQILGPRANRVANIVAGVVVTAVQLGSNFVGTPSPYYVLFSIIEIATTAVIVWFAWTWRHEASSTSAQLEATRSQPIAGRGQG